MNTDRFPRPKPILSMAALAGWLVIVMAFGGTALAASAPTITKITQKDTNGTPDPSDDKVVTMATAFEVNKIGADGQGNSYVTEPATGIVYMFNSNGHLVRSHRSVSRPLGVAASDKYDAGTDKTVTTVFVGGNSNGYRTVFMLNQSGAVKGYLRRLPTDVEPINFGSPNNIAVDSSGNVYVADGKQNIVQMFDGDGVFVKTFGPYPDKSIGIDLTFSRYFSSELIGTTTYSKTRHTMIEPSGVSVANGELYIAFKERVEYLTTASDASCVITGDTYTDSKCYPDTEDSYKKYLPENPAYKNWNLIGEAQVVAVIDMNTMQITRRITVSPFLVFGYNGSSYRINAMAADNSGRLYVATNSAMKVFDAAVNNRIDASTPFTVTGFPLGNYMGVAYDSKYNRLFASGGNTVSLYGIDCTAGVCPAPDNKAPGAPVLLSPVSTYASTLTPSLDVRNAIDAEADPLTYSYELKDSNGALISSSLKVVEGAAGMTYMPVSDTLTENALYRWRAQSFDGNSSSWSAGDWSSDKNNWAEFCVNAQNDNPDAPVLIGPAIGAPVSPFSSSLAWSSSKDPDCYDTVSYIAEISTDSNFGSLLSSRSLSNQSVKFADLTTALVNGSTYYWRVKAVDNNGGETSSNIGSFAYRTTVVKFESGQPGAKVFIDGNYGYSGRLLGTAPLTVEGINPGSHFVSFVKAGYEPVYKIINVADPLDNESLLTVTAEAEEWLKASRIKPAAAATELFRTSGNSTPFVVDYNNDGLKDVIAGDADGNVYLYLSVEQQIEGEPKKVVLVAQGAIQNINVGSNSAPFVVDYDNDGKKDLIVGAGNGLIYRYINGGSDHLPVFTSAEAIKDNSGSDIKASNSAPNVIDYNNDGKKDLVVGGIGGALRLYLNSGTDASPEFGIPSLIQADNSDLSVGVNANSRVFFTDWNSDGKKDMVVGGSTLNLFLNVGTDAAPDFKSIAALQDWIKNKKRERGNREFISYLGYNQDLADVVGASTDIAPFVVNWDGLSARDVIAGTADGTVISHLTP